MLHVESACVAHVDASTVSAFDLRDHILKHMALRVLHYGCLPDLCMPIVGFDFIFGLIDAR